MKQTEHQLPDTLDAAFPRVVDAGDSGLVVLFGDTLDMQVNNAVHAFDASLQQQHLDGITEIVPAIRGLLIRYDPLLISNASLRDQIEAIVHTKDWLTTPPNPDRKIWQLPVHYGEESGPDIDNVAKQLGVSINQVIQQHSQARVRVLMLGFAPGCAYLGALPESWELPRLDYVKPEIPAGSLSVAVRQTVLFANAMPTGWQTIARTPFHSFSKHIAPYFRLSPGDEVRFLPVDYQQFLALQQQVAAGKLIVAPSAP